MPITILALPDDIFHLIFARITLHDLVRVGLVCTRFRAMQQLYSRTRHALSLAFGTESLELIRDSSFDHRFLDGHFTRDQLKTFSPNHVRGPVSRVEQLSPHECSALSNLFAHITVLSLAQDRHAYPDWTLMFALLSRAQNLLVLKLFISADSSMAVLYNSTALKRASPPDLHKLFCYIGRLSSLKQLTLELQEVDLPSDVLSLLPRQLEQFYIRANCGFDLIVDFLNNKNVNEIQQEEDAFAQLTLLGVCDYDCGNVFLNAKLSQISPQMSAKFVYFGAFAIEPKQLNEACGKFTSLRSLSLNAEDMSLNELTTALAQLPQLFHLKLQISFTEKTRLESEHKKAKKNKTNPLIKQMTSIRALSICIWTRNHKHLEPLHPEWTFPNLELLHYFQGQGHCEDCDYEWIEHIPVAQQETCFKRILKPFKRCSKLKRIYFEKDGDEANEMCLTDRFFTKDQL